MLGSFCQVAGRKSNETASLKADGTKILTCSPYEKAGKNITILDDKLTVVTEFPQEDNLNFIRSAIALPNFDKFLILSDDGKGNGQLLLSDNVGKTIKKTTFITGFQADASSPSIVQASLTSDNKYVALAHGTVNNPGISMLRIYDAETLIEVSNRPLVAKVTAPQSFVLSTTGGMFSGPSKKVYYWALNATTADQTRGLISQLEFYRLDSNLDLVPAKTPVTAEWKLQRIVEKSSLANFRFMVNVVDNKALFVSSMTITDKSKEQIGIFEYIPSSDCKEGSINNLLTEEHDPEMVRLVVSPDNKYLFYSQKLVDNHSNFAWSILKIQRDAPNKVKLVPITLSKLSKGTATTVAFSADCKTLLIGCNTLSIFRLNLTA